MNSTFIRMQENCELRKLSRNTQRTYLRIIRQFSEYFMRSPDELGTEEIRKYLLHLKRDKKQSPQTLDVVYSTLKFFYHAVLDRSWEISPVPRIQLDRKLPVVLSTEEITSEKNPDSPSNIAEMFEIDEAEFISANDIVVISGKGDSILAKSHSSYLKTAAGIISGNPAILINNCGSETKVYPVKCTMQD